MRIEKIELIGFKSFADKTAFVLHPGITCIVGPNGCGKSNIVDAFRWVLGEQSAKSLRGEKMEEVIFNGSATKKQKGMAEVTLVVAGLNGAGNGNGANAGDQVTVTRRLFRSGESEYMINKTPCRLRDIKDVFLDTGLDFKSYSILEQGRIGEILNSKPLERRFILEEVAGVMKYKVRKAEALSKLESSRANLVRINDVITEVKKQINILDRLAKKAERYRRLAEELHAIELKLARREYHMIGESLRQILEEHGVLKEKEAALGADVTSRENRVERRRIDLIDREKALESVQREFQQLERDIADRERIIAVGRNDVGNFREYHGKLLQQVADMVRRTEELTGRREDLEELATRLSAELEATADELRARGERLREVEETLTDKEDRIEEKRREIFKLSEEVSRKKNDLSRFQSLLESLEKRQILSQQDAESGRKRLAEIEAAIAAVEAEMYGRKSEILLMQEKREVLSQELAAAKNRLSDLTGALALAREELASSTSRIESLKEIVFDRPTRELISQNPGVTLLASLSDVLEVEARCEKAIESALAEKADAIIVGSYDDIDRALEAIAGQEVDRAAFIPVSPTSLPPADAAPGGVLGRALDFVKVAEGYGPVAAGLLRHVLIVEDMRTAIGLKGDAPGATFAALSGEVLDASGAVVVGGEKGIFRRRREIRELEALVDEKKTIIESLGGEIRLLQQAIAGKEEAIRGAESSIHGLEKEVSLSRLTLENHTSDKERTSKKLSYLAIEIEGIVREKESVSTSVAAAEEQLRHHEEARTVQERELTELQEGILLKRAEIEEYRSEVTDLRLAAASSRERLDAVRNEAESLERTLAEMGQKDGELRGEVESVLGRISRRESEIQENEGILRRLVSDADLMRADISRKREEVERENEDLLAVEHEIRGFRQQLTAVTARVSELDVQRAEHRLRLENIATNVRNAYGREIGEVEFAEVSAEEEERLGELRKKIQEIGPVNLGTLDEYEELKGRYDFMVGQQEDLNKSIAELEEAISKINQTTRKKLRDAFELLKVKFSEVFVTLFGGGRAELVLTDEHNILETGVDIVAQPPGKKLQNLHLLSGGEKALTALSLQFASFLIKPTPLCILDEADAPLDESNTERFSMMIQELSQDTQFIVVTHNRTTMAVAQHLYGITMEEAGVSKVISMQFAEAGA